MLTIKLGEVIRVGNVDFEVIEKRMGSKNKVTVSITAPRDTKISRVVQSAIVVGKVSSDGDA